MVLRLFDSRGKRSVSPPASAYGHVRNLYPVFWDKSAELVRALQVAVSTSSESGVKGSDVVEVNEWASRASLDIIGQGGFGHAFDAINDPSNDLTRTYRGIFAPGRTGQVLEIMVFLLPQWIVRHLPCVACYVHFPGSGCSIDSYLPIPDPHDSWGEGVLVLLVKLIASLHMFARSKITSDEGDSENRRRCEWSDFQFRLLVYNVNTF